jgi:hypothetical protein
LGDATTAKDGRLACHQHPQYLLAALARLVEAGEPVLGPAEQFRRICAGAESGDEEKGRRLVRAE